MKKALGLLAAMIVLYGCGADKDDNMTEDTNTPSDEAIVYMCGAQEVKVDFDNETDPPSAELFFTGKTHEPIMLSLTVAASGAKYSDGEITFWTHPGEAMLMMEGDDGASVKCDQKTLEMDDITASDGDRSESEL
jgi:membrane-bound inhibitor of C-type lysozyme